MYDVEGCGNVPRRSRSDTCCFSAGQRVGKPVAHVKWNRNETEIKLKQNFGRRSTKLFCFSFISHVRPALRPCSMTYSVYPIHGVDRSNWNHGVRQSLSCFIPISFIEFQLRKSTSWNAGFRNPVWYGAVLELNNFFSGIYINTHHQHQSVRGLHEKLAFISL
jgi:hypothetical protein